MVQNLLLSLRSASVLKVRRCKHHHGSVQTPNDLEMEKKEAKSN